MDTLDDYEMLAVDLLRRTEAAMETIAAIAVDTGMTFQIADVVQRVEDDLPADYPEAAAGDGGTRRDVIEEMARDIFDGNAYDD
ncbi:hypothetical protein ACIQU6_03315 [Streptomyces sp. NPDC090442]|uniref:hypothetical protein n=1 Tax=Streptomyces sp. NPDC090442 TaxID=3365962 RepID=UPI0038028EC8